MMLVLSPAGGKELALGPAAIDRLGELGITNVSLLRDGVTVGVVLDGWAFDPSTSGAKAAEIVGMPSSGAILLPVMQAAVTTTGRSGDEGA